MQKAKKQTDVLDRQLAIVSQNRPFREKLLGLLSRSALCNAFLPLKCPFQGCHGFTEELQMSLRLFSKELGNLKHSFGTFWIACQSLLLEALNQRKS